MHLLVDKCLILWGWVKSRGVEELLVVLLGLELLVVLAQELLV